MRHEVYVAKRNDTEAGLDDPDTVLYILGRPRGLRKAWRGVRARDEVFRAGMEDGFGEPQPTVARWPVNEHSVAAMDALVAAAGETTLRELFEGLVKDGKVAGTEEEFRKTIREFYEAAKKSGLILLKNKNVEMFPKTHSLAFYKLGDSP